jgi:hypothetical protein
MQSNKGRFKCPHEAQAVWCFFTRRYSFDEVRLFKEGDFLAESCLTLVAEDLHHARLIQGTIYDEDGRIEDKDVAHELCLSYQESGWLVTNIDGHIRDSIRDSGVIMQTNKGRFKCPHEAQAVWNVFKAQVANRWFVEQFEIGSEHGVLALDAFANDLYINGLIHGTIYDEDERMYRDAELQLEFNRTYHEESWPSYDYFVDYMLEEGKIRGTIFY